MNLVPLPRKRRDALLREMHGAIQQATNDLLLALASGTWTQTYPPGAKVDASHVERMRDLASNPLAATAIADAAAAAFFRTLAVMDGVGDPVGWQGHWAPIVLAEDTDGDDIEMLHDAFFETYAAAEPP